MLASPGYTTGRALLSPHAQATIEKHLPNAKQLLQYKTPTATQKRDVSCITDLCSSEHLPEVEIFSLLAEQIPKYRIRSDPMTEFSGYKNQDWYIPFPTLQLPKDSLGLTKDQMRETLNYFLLSGERVSQMTKVYDDVEAVTRLLEEKEKDLELTVQIGKELLAQNNRLESKVVGLETNLKTITENYQQLTHELIQKNEFLSILTHDVESSNIENVTPTSSHSSKTFNLDLLQTKILSLQDENSSLRRQTSQITHDTEECEQIEKKLFDEITTQLYSTNVQFDGLNLELERYKEENRVLQEQISNLTTRLTETELKFHEISNENEETISILGITKENQSLLASELAEFKIRYQEVLSLLNETQDQLRTARKKNQPSVPRSTFLTGLPIPQVDSLQFELMETSMYSDNSADSGIAMDKIGLANSDNQHNMTGLKKVFDTVKCVSRPDSICTDGSMVHLGAMTMSSTSQPKMSSNIQPINLNNMYRTSSVPYTKYVSPSMESSMDARASSQESLYSDLESNYPGHAPSGCPGAPGAKDLEAALKRLTPAEVLARRAMLQHAPAGTYCYEENATGLPHGFRTPDSIMSVGSYSMTTSSYFQPQWRLPAKLQIVKPMEGSQTLRHWNRLATPTLGGLLDDRPGVTIRGGRGVDEIGLPVYSISDCEEDIDDNPGKNFPSSSCVYTFTNSTVLHPDDGISVVSSVPPSQMVSRMTSCNVSRQTSAPMTPRSLSRRNSCSTFSVNLGLASMLNERGIKAVTPSALNTPCGINYSPTVTPCNSPNGSPERHISPEPQFLSGLLSSGAHLLRRKLIGEIIESKQHHLKPRQGNKLMLSRLEKRALKSIKILEKVEHMGLENIIAPSPNICPLSTPLQGTSALYSSRCSSPMAQLTSLKKLGSYENEEVHIDRRVIKAALSKALSNENLHSSLNDELNLNKKPPEAVKEEGSSVSNDMEPVNYRLKQLHRQKSRRNFKNGHGGQRPDLGTVGHTSTVINKSLGDKTEPQSIGFIGQISSLLFGRKGGLL